jgi:N6-adenosine-specific RNA methylase IME4
MLHTTITTTTAATTSSLAEHATEIHRLGKRVVADVIEIGQRLKLCKDICGHGNWLSWLEREFAWSDETARKYMRAADLATKFQPGWNLNVPLSALYLLAAPSTPDEAREAIIERVNAGEAVSTEDIKTEIAAPAANANHDSHLRRPGAERSPSGIAMPPHVTAAVERAIASSEENRRRQEAAGNGVDPEQSAERRKTEAQADDDEAERSKADAVEADPQELVAVGRREILAIAKRLKAEGAEARRTERIERIGEISKGNTPLPSGRRYPVILADVAWQFAAYGPAGDDRAPDYPTMSLDQVCTLPVGELATESAILFAWTTAPHLEQSFKVIAAWGFTYSTGMVWVKTGGAPGLGYVVRVDHEHLLIARRGDFPSPPTAARPSSVITAPRREHSRKPDEVYGLIEAMYPSLPRIELFARHAREGWASWGNQVPACAPPPPADGLTIPPFLDRRAAP